MPCEVTLPSVFWLNVSGKYVHENLGSKEFSFIWGSYAEGKSRGVTVRSSI